ncbi:MAG: iron-sulfur cluster assembly protein [Caldiserica bacterium]|jgi:metal-sulfur cluster biosynthetic enzyme|nr:iron-sulfur cluster assembly protein [Caldisericota bacterium]
MIEREQILDALRAVYDPEIPINVVDLGLIYGVEVTADGDVTVRMTMTAPQCPMSGYLLQQAEQGVRTVAGVRDVNVDLVFDPPWEPSMIKEDALKSAGIVTDAPADLAGGDCSTEK